MSPQQESFTPCCKEVLAYFATLSDHGLQNLPKTLMSRSIPLLPRPGLTGSTPPTRMTTGGDSPVQ